MDWMIDWFNFTFSLASLFKSRSSYRSVSLSSGRRCGACAWRHCCVCACQEPSRNCCVNSNACFIEISEYGVVTCAVVSVAEAIRSTTYVHVYMPLQFITSSPAKVRSNAMSVSVCLSVHSHIWKNRYVQTSRNFLYMLPANFSPLAAANALIHRRPCADFNLIYALYARDGRIYSLPRGVTGVKSEIPSLFERCFSKSVLLNCT